MVTKALYDPSGGALCLDFVNTVNRPRDRPWRESVTGYADLVRWSLEAGTCSVRRAAALRRAAAHRPQEAETVVTRARALREATYHVFVAFPRGRKVASKHLEVINAEIGASYAHARIGRAAGDFVWTWRPAPEELEALLWPIARSTAELLTSGERTRVKECAGDGCYWLFLDHTKNHARRWCDMKVCGNRTKVRRHRRRKREEG